MTNTKTTFDETVPDALAEAIAENPHEVARFLERLNLVNEFLDAADVAVSGLDDDMVAELAGTSTTLALAANGLATSETVELGETVGENADDLSAAIETLVGLQRDGTLDDLAALGDLVSLGSAALDDEMVTSLAHTGGRLGELADTAADDDTARGVGTLLTAVGAANATDAEQVGPVGIVRALRDPEVQTGMGFVVALARELGRAKNA
ncbi:Uncharacterized conserved protein YjgD, DUF1641 family [Halogranum amylolyticum]|uniref:Uncharacterized conserved protein YjgD, DUF1641 family n=1 Tax=Halogranum amylolyticum TaxID=660520 RepID=A0A1H8QUJ9_9EURY|nr:DUF1641 domain-containing protein [Halogranum amylolyticum]SEO57949.1 Uncharacterized conserved protein YjgD, DUF1641 family [Halogranum amylolyticum]